MVRKKRLRVYETVQFEVKHLFTPPTRVEYKNFQARLTFQWNITGSDRPVQPVWRLKGATPLWIILCIHTLCVKKSRSRTCDLCEAHLPAWWGLWSQLLNIPHRSFPPRTRASVTGGWDNTTITLLMGVLGGHIPNPSHLSLTINCTASILVNRRVRRAVDATSHQLIHSDVVATSKAQHLFHTELLNTNMTAKVPRRSFDVIDQADAH